jgi:hypothetical protein
LRVPSVSIHRSHGDTCLSEATGNDCTLVGLGDLTGRGSPGVRRGSPTHYKCVVGIPRAI